VQAGGLKSQSQRKKVHVQVEHSVRTQLDFRLGRLAPSTSFLPLTLSSSLDSPGSGLAFVAMRINILNRPLFDSFFGVIDLKQGQSSSPPPSARVRAILSTSSPSPALSPSHLLSATANTGVADSSIDTVCVSLGVMLVIFFGVRPRSSLRQDPTRPPCLPMTLTQTPHLSNHHATPQLFNKIAGVYGLFGACFAGGTIGQLSFYIYSTASLAGFVWGLKAVVEVRLSSVRFPFAITDEMV
jgi:hypothetical protein